MELDLDAFLRSRSTSDDDDDDDDDLLHSRLHRTVDEILLNDSDSDSSSSASSAPSSLNYRRPADHSRPQSLLQQESPPPPRNDDVSACSPKTLSDSCALLESFSSSETSHSDDKPPADSKFSTSSISRLIKSGEFSGSDRNGNVLPPLLFAGVGVRSNAKPGAALAAAAAASRLVPTPHAAAIKSRRASSGTLRKVLDTEDGPGSGTSYAEVVSDSEGHNVSNEPAVASEICQSDAELVEEDVKRDHSPSAQVQVVARGNFSLGDRMGESSSYAGEDEDIPITELPTQVELVSEVDDLRFDNLEEVSSSPYFNQYNITSPLNLETNRNLDDACTLSGSNDAKDDLAPSSPADDVNRDVHSVFINAMESTENGVPSSAGSDHGRKVDEDLAFGMCEKHDIQNVIPQSNDGYLNLAGEDTSSRSDVTDLVDDIILQWKESKRGTKRTGKKSLSSMKPLELAEELEKKHAFTGLHWEEGAAAQPMRLEGVRRGSTVLGYFDIDANNTITRTISSQAFRRDNGSPQVVAVHLNFIAVGMSKGVIAVMPSKYFPQYADNMDAKMLMLGLQGDRSHAAVTSMCFNQQGDLLFAGYGDGHITVWDLQKASAVKVINEHNAQVVHMLYVGQDSQVTRQFIVVSGDSKSLVLMITFSVVPWLNRFSIKTVRLLDGQTTSKVLCASVLLSDECCGGALMSSQGNTAVSSSAIGTMMGGVVGGDAGWKFFAERSSLVEEGVVILVTHQTALVVKLAPSVQVYAHLSKPDGVREGSMPYTAWKCMVQSHGASTENLPVEAAEKVSLLAIAWDRKVQVGKLVKSELKICGKWTLESSAIGVAWLDDQMLVVLTLNGQLCLFAKDGTAIHQTSFSLDGSGGDDLIACHTYLTNMFGNPEKAYHNCVAVRGATVYILGPMRLVISRLLPWKERIQVLRKAGDWMGALNMAMALYDGQSHGVIDLPRTLDAVQEAIMPHLVELLLSYVDEVFSYISVAFCNQIEKLEQLDDSKSRSSSVHSEIKEQFTRVGGVSVEFCVHIKRTDILFDEILSKFVAVQHRDTFLELLEPYILKDMLGSLPPEIMQALVEHYSMKGWLQRVEQCVLHMDISSLDFNQVVRLCREHRLYGALIYLFNKGLDDFRAPLEELLVVLQSSQRENAAALGYRMLVYLKYCFSGLAFPPGHGTLPPSRLPSLRIELVQFLLEDSNGPNSWTATSLSLTEAFPNLYHLLELDTEATLKVLHCAFVEDEISKEHYHLHSADASLEAMQGIDSMAESRNLVQKIVNVLVCILDRGDYQTDKSTSSDDIRITEIWPPKKDMGHIFEFIAYYVSCERANVSKGILSQILEYLTSDINITPSVLKQNIETLKGREKQVLALLEVVPETDWDASYVLHLCEHAQFFQVCGFIHAIRHQNLAALDCYMKDVDEPIHAFSFISDALLQLSDTDSDAFQLAVISRIPDLVKLSRECTFFLVNDHFYTESERILAELQSHPECLFLYLKTIIEVHLSGTLNFSGLRKADVDFSSGRRARDQSKRVEAYLERVSDFPMFLRNNPIHVTDEMTELYLELLCRYEQDSVLKFLETFENYRVEHCLRLCQEYGIIDAAAFLLERVGDVGSALLLTLSGLNDKFVMLDAAVGGVSSDPSMDNFSIVLRKKEVKDILNILHACIGLCQRNSPRLDPDESESLWFQLLDSFCEPLAYSQNDKMVSEGESPMRMLAESSGRQGEDEACKIKWKISKSHNDSHTLRKLFSQFIKEIVEGMVGYVRLPTIMSKLLSDNGSQEFGDFKLTILGMLGTYDFERRILDTAKSLIEDDTFYTMSLLKKGASHGYAPRGLTCCICNCLLTKNTSSSCIRVFSCGHATHLQCELQENEASHLGSSASCPICMPKKKAQRTKSKSILRENGLLSKSASKPQLAQGTIGFHPHESDAFESYGFRISRFEILTNLQKEQRMIQIENMPRLRLAPPTVYHEKVKKGVDFLRGESSSDLAKIEKPSKSRQLRELKMKGSTIRFPLKSNIFGEF